MTQLNNFQSALPSDPPEPIADSRPDRLKFMVIDDHPDGRFLVAKTLLRKFPNAMIIECQSAQTAFLALRTEAINGIVAHRTFDFDGTSLVQALRKLHASVPIVMMSGVDRKAAGLEAGATCFLLCDQWLMIGNVVDALLGSPESTPALPLTGVSTSGS